MAWIIAVSSKFAIRLVDADYELTRFGNDFTKGNNNQSNFRFQTGRRFRLSRMKAGALTLMVYIQALDLD